MPPNIGALLAALCEVQAALDERVAGLAQAHWRTPSPVDGRNDADCIGHLSYIDRAVVLVITDAEHARWMLTVLDTGPDVAEARRGNVSELLTATWAGRDTLLEQAVRQTGFDGCCGRDQQCHLPAS